MVDDGPLFMYKDAATFMMHAITRAEPTGFSVYNYLLQGAGEHDYSKEEFGNPIPAVSFFPAGVIGKLTPNNQFDLYGSEPWLMWYDFVTSKMVKMGMVPMMTSTDKKIEKHLRSLRKSQQVSK